MPPPTREHLLDRSPFAERLNGLLAHAWARGWCEDPPLTAEALWAKASRGFQPADEAGGRSADEVEDFRTRLERLTDSIRGDADLNPLGRTIAHGQLVRVIRQRLALGRLWRARPHVLDTPLAPPIIVVGQMRSGTTRLHRLLSADPRFSSTRFCDSWLPVPSRIDLRRWQGAGALWFARLLNPWLDTLHPFGSARVDEELGWLAAALDHCAYEAQWRIPAYTAWSEARGALPVYREFARILATDAAHRGNAALPRVLKVPQFSEDLAELLQVFPTARVIRCQRDAEAVVTSTVSLCANQMAMQSDSISIPELEREARRKLALREARTDAALARFAGRVATAEFDALQRDWRGSIAAIYRTLGLEVTPAAWAAMERECAAAASDPHHHHRQDLQRLAPRRLDPSLS
ncbi:sulfotransferase [Parafrankia sp. BMG5.11]|nr:sulfotransferase [Parafrankia sp. BMG5.11]